MSSQQPLFDDLTTSFHSLSVTSPAVLLPFAIYPLNCQETPLFD